MIFRRRFKSHHAKSSFAPFGAKKNPLSRLKPRTRRLKRRAEGKTLIATHEPSSERRTRIPKGRWATFKRVLILVIGIAFLFWGVHQLFLSERLNIKTITIIEDQEPQLDHPIQKLLNDYKGSNLLLFDNESIEAYLSTQYPHYASLHVRKNLPDTLVVVLKTHPIVANLIVNLETEDGETKKKELLLNASGLAIDTKGQAVDLKQPTIKIHVDQPIKQGDRVVEPEHLAFILEAKQNFEDKFGMAVLHTDYKRIPREAHLWTERNFYVWLDITSDLDLQLNKLKQALPRLNIYEENLSYVDLRISGLNGEKVIFKRR